MQGSENVAQGIEADGFGVVAAMLKVLDAGENNF